MPHPSAAAPLGKFGERRQREKCTICGVLSQASPRSPCSKRIAVGLFLFIVCLYINLPPGSQLDPHITHDASLIIHRASYITHHVTRIPQWLHIILKSYIAHKPNPIPNPKPSPNPNSNPNANWNPDLNLSYTMHHTSHISHIIRHSSYGIPCLKWYDMIWYDMIWYDVIMIWYDVTWYDMTWYDMTWYDMIWYDVIWYDMIWYDMIWYDMI